MKEKLEELCRKFDELTARMGDPEIYSDPNLFQKIAKEAAELEPIAKTYRVIESAKAGLADAQELIEIEDDPEMVDLAKAEIVELEQTIDTKSEELQFLLLPKDPNDEKNAYISIIIGLIFGFLFFPSPDFSKSLLVGILLSKEIFSPFISQSLLFLSFIIATFLPFLVLKAQKIKF